MWNPFCAHGIEYAKAPCDKCVLEKKNARIAELELLAYRWLLSEAQGGEPSEGKLYEDTYKAIGCPERNAEFKAKLGL